MSHHMDDGVNQAITALADALCMWERDTGRRSTLVLIPYQLDEPIALLLDGKPAPGVDAEELLVAIADALAVRSGNTEVERIVREAAVQCLQVKFDLADAPAGEAGG